MRLKSYSEAEFYNITKCELYYRSWIKKKTTLNTVRCRGLIFMQ